MILLKRIKRYIYNKTKHIGNSFGFDLPYFVENGFWAVSGQLAAYFFMFLLSIVMTRLLSKEVYGTYQYILSIVSLFSIVSLPGLSTSISKSVANGFDYSYIRGVKLSVKYAFFGVPVIIAFAFFYFNEDKSLFYSLILSGLFFPLSFGFDKWSSFLVAKEMFAKKSVFIIVYNIINFIFLSLTSYLFPDDIVIIVFIYFMVLSVTNIFFYKKTLIFVNNKKQDKDCFSYGKYLTKTQILILISGNFDKVVLSFVNIEFLAGYAVAQKLLSIVQGILKSLFSVSFPKFAKQNVSIRAYYIVLLFLLGAFTAIVLYFTIDFAVLLLYTDKYAESATLFKYFSVVIPFFFVNSLLVNKINAQKKYKKILLIRSLPQFLSLIISLTVFLLTKNTVYFVVTKIVTIQILRFIILIYPERT